MSRTNLTPDLQNLCEYFLPHVSRTFALTIPVLRKKLQDEVGLAYLLCRIVDTVEDHPHLSEAGRNAHLDLLSSAVNSDLDWGVFLSGLPEHPHKYYQELTTSAPAAFQARDYLPAPARAAVDRCLLDMISGMRAFPGRRGDEVVLACDTLEALEVYCHAAAGTVGILLTRLFSAHTPRPWHNSDQIELGRRFGLGLQITNILKDHGDDRKRGVQYLPPVDVLLVIQRALTYLEAGHLYLLSIPKDAVDLRLFCAIPHCLALKTLAALLRGESKITKDQVRICVAETQQAVASDQALISLYQDQLSELKPLLTVST